MSKKSTPAVVDVFNITLNYFTNLKYFFKKEFITKGYWLHFLCSIPLCIVAIIILFLYFNLNGTGLFFQLILGAVLGLVGNAIREGYLENTKGTEFSWVDCHFGSYAGILSALILNILWQ
jgi:hypothetical protein